MYTKEEVQRRMSQPYSKWTSDDFELARELDKEKQQTGVNQPVPPEKMAEYKDLTKGQGTTSGSQAQIGDNADSSWTQANVFDIVNETSHEKKDVRFSTPEAADEGKDASTPGKPTPAPSTPTKPAPSPAPSPAPAPGATPQSEGKDKKEADIFDTALEEHNKTEAEKAQAKAAAGEEGAGEGEKEEGDEEDGGEDGKKKKKSKKKKGAAGDEGGGEEKGGSKKKKKDGGKKGKGAGKGKDSKGKKKSKKKGQARKPQLDRSQSASIINTSSSSRLSSPKADDSWANLMLLFSRWTCDERKSVSKSPSQHQCSPELAKVNRGVKAERKHESEGVSSSTGSDDSSIHVDSLAAPGGFVPSHPSKKQRLSPADFRSIFTTPRPSQTFLSYVHHVSPQQHNRSLSQMPTCSPRRSFPPHGHNVQDQDKSNTEVDSGLYAASGSRKTAFRLLKTSHVSGHYPTTAKPSRNTEYDLPSCSKDNRWNSQVNVVPQETKIQRLPRICLGLHSDTSSEDGDKSSNQIPTACGNELVLPTDRGTNCCQEENRPSVPAAVRLAAPAAFEVHPVPCFDVNENNRTSNLKYSHTSSTVGPFCSAYPASKLEHFAQKLERTSPLTFIELTFHVIK
ncbi:uncharacterized protein LOC143277675 [Babylonia areolata]|uniref:uncharacterized protein LOC143277675 n=1 Tax=Babylonia areolata TaxID=304850 RepID=UPI003FD368E7